MEGKLPEIFWYLFWIGFVILAFRLAYLGGKAGFDVRMRALDILKQYADKDIEPPAAVMDELTRQAFEPPPQGKPGAMGGLMLTFSSFLFLACVTWGIREWLEGRATSSWAPIAATAALAFFAIGAAAFLVAALVRRKD
jgi:hypothetical protein